MVITHGQSKGVSVAVKRVREELEGHPFTLARRCVQVTASFGIAGHQRGEDAQFENLIARVDKALYAAKRLGRNSSAFPGLEAC
jgi:diguanylate cyclase (GGDEF)-like protein